MADIKAGDVVILKSDRKKEDNKKVKMTVGTAYHGGAFECYWFRDYEFHTAQIHGEALLKIELD